jgi:hypothetical protein
MDDKPKILRADEVIAPDPLADMRSKAACLPDDADDNSDAGMPTTSHEDEGWRSAPIFKP